MPKASAPTVNGLIVARIDDLQATLSTQLHDLKADLGEKIAAVDERVKVQNSRIGKCEARLEKAATVEATTAKVEAKFTSRQVAVVGAMFGVGSPVLLKVAELVLAHLRTP